MDGDRIMSAPWFPEFLEQVRSAVTERAADRFDVRPGLEHEITQLETQKQGWTQSLGNPSLPPVLRTNLETNYAAAEERHREIEDQLHRIDHHEGARR